MTSPNLPGQRRYVNPILNEPVAIEALRLDLDYLNPETVDPAIARQALVNIQQLMSVLRRFQRQLGGGDVCCHSDRWGAWRALPSLRPSRHTF